VLDRLLEEETIEIEGISGTSAGAMNAIALAHGLCTGGREGARQGLADFWRAVAARTPCWPLLGGAVTAAHGSRGELPAGVKALLGITRVFSPAQLNPLDINPLRAVLDASIDFEALRRCACAPKLFIIATRVRTGQLRMFENAELSTEVALASACLPSLHHPVEIDGEAYWDGAYSGNPAVFPLVYRCRSKDMLVVLLHPSSRAEAPRDAQAIHERIAELSFSATFLREMSAIGRVRRETAGGLFRSGRIERRLRALRVYLIETDGLLGRLSTDSKLNTHLDFLTMLRDQGRERAQRWLDDYRTRPDAAQVDLAMRFCI
jgi:NTE family protein